MKPTTKKLLIVGAIVAPFLIGFAIGGFVDNRFAPKVKMVDGKITFEWSDKNKKA